MFKILPYCLATTLFLCMFTGAQDDTFVENIFLAEGKASTQDAAIVRARVDAMSKYLRLNMDESDYEAHRNAIDTFLVENYRELSNDNINIVEPYYERTIRVMVEVKGDLLMDRVRSKFLRARRKALGIWASVNSDQKVRSSRSLDIVLSTVQNELGKHFTVRDVPAMKRLIQKESQMFDLSAGADPKNYTWRKFSSIPIAMYFWLKVGIKKDPATGERVYRARIGARGVHVVTAQELFHFQHDALSSQRDDAIVRGSIEVANKIVTQVGQYNTVLPEGEYTYKFVNFHSKADRDKIKQTMLDLKNGSRRYLDILPGGIGGGPNYFTYKVKWMRSHSSFEMIQIVLEHLETNQLPAKCDKFTQKVMYFEPPNSNWNPVADTPVPTPNYPKQPIPVEEPEYDDCDYIEVTGTGATTDIAIARAWRKAMMLFLEENMEEEYYESNYSKIEKYVAENYRKYKLSEAIIVERLSRREVTVKLCIDGDSLLSKVMYLFKKADNKLKGLWVALVADKEKNVYQNTDPNRKDESTDRDVMFDSLQNRLGKHMQIRDLRAIDRLMKKEAQMLGMAAGTDPQAYVARKFAQVQIVVYLWLTTRRISRDPATGTPVWHATVGCRLVHIQTAQELVKFQISSGTGADAVAVGNGFSERMARAEAIRNVTKACYERIYKQIRSRKTVLQENIYTIKFVKFSQSQERRIKEAILSLKEGKRAYCKIENAVGGGSGYLEYILKWRRTRDSQSEIIDIISGYCEENEVAVDSNKSTKGVMYFEPISYDDEY